MVAPEAASSRTTVIPIAGMTCSVCAGRVERALTKASGVVSAEVSFATKSAKVTLAADADVDVALTAITKAGYEPAATRAQILAREAAGAAAKKEEEDRRVLARSAVIALAVASLQMLVGMPLMSHGHGMASSLASPSVHPFLRYALLASTLYVLVLARSFFVRAWAALRARTADMNTLVALGAGTAFLYSAAATLAPGAFSADGSPPDVHFEAASFILAFVMIGRALEERARARTTEAQGALLALVPATATLLRGDEETKVPAEHVRPGDVFVLRPGDRAPADGTVVKGESLVDESLLTGESARTPRREGDIIHAGTLAANGLLHVRATLTGSDTRISRIASLTSEAQATRAPVQRKADRVAAIFAPAIVLFALAAAIAWAAFGPEPKLVNALTTFVTVVVVSCPCALGLATPTAIATAVGRAAQLGILVRSADALERAAAIDVVALDKTGTLTAGEPTLVSFEVSGEGPLGEDEVLAHAASVEHGSEHPVGAAIVAAAEARGLALHDAKDFVAFAGAGARARVGGRDVRVGAIGWLEESGVVVGDAKPPAEAAFGVAIDGALRGWGVVADRVRDEAREAVAQLLSQGVQVVMLTGDREDVARAVAERVGIEDVRAGLSPEGKQAELRALAASGRHVAMCGDGVNDSPALASAHVGISVAGGTDAAMESSDITLLSEGIASLPDVIGLARSTLRVIGQNLAWAFAYNLVLVPVAAGALVPVLGVRLPPALASVAMALSSISVVTSSLRLRRFKRGPARE
ncbi:MAG: cadmium-translocating P-type ATPase [Deltaproteobacteria bacterium]|nr:cadmium-translocating P-type ATPase [Deltaproteobacteria bacterium]